MRKVYYFKKTKMAKSSQSNTTKNKDTSGQSSAAAAGSQSDSNKEQSKEEKGKKFEKEGVVFKAKLIGLELVPESGGDKIEICQSLIQKSKAIIKGTNTHKKRITLKISYEGIKVFDEKNPIEMLHHHKVPEISYVASDEQDSRAFGYVFGLPGKTHQFICFKTSGPALSVTVCISELFVAVLDKKNKKKEEKAKEEQRSKDDKNTLFTNGDCSTNSIETNSSSSGIGSSAGSVSMSSAKQNSIDHLSTLLFGSSPSSSPSTWGTSSLAQQVNKHQAPFQAPRQPTVEKLREENSSVGLIPLLPSPPSKHRQLLGSVGSVPGSGGSAYNNSGTLVRSSSPLFSLDAFDSPIPASTTVSQMTNLPGDIGSRHSNRNKSSASVFSMSISPRLAPVPASCSLQNESGFSTAFATSSSSAKTQPTFNSITTSNNNSSGLLRQLSVTSTDSIDRYALSSAAQPTSNNTTTNNNSSSGLLRQLSVTSTDSIDRYAAFNEIHNLPSVFETAVIQQQKLSATAAASNNDINKFQFDFNNHNQEQNQQQLQRNQSSNSFNHFNMTNNSNNSSSSRDIFKRTNPFADDFFS